MVLAIIIGGTVWWFARTTGNTAAASTPVTSAAKADAPKTVAQAAPVAQVELPKALAAAAKPETAGSQAEAVAIAQAEVKATFQDMARTLREQGLAATEQAFLNPEYVAKTSPEEWRQRIADEENAQNPDLIQHLEKGAEYYDYLATLTPTINAAGDRAIFFNGSVNDDGTPKRLAVFNKINGKWYFNQYLGDDP